MRGFLVFLSVFLILLTPELYAKSGNELKFYTINLKKDVGSTTWVYIQNGMKNADNLDADAIFISMNTYGGEVQYADSIRTKILHSKIPVYVFINNNAASAGALISIACRKIFMSPSATIGAASVVNQNGEKMPDKYQSYMRATMRATAEFHGKDTTVLGNDTIIKWKRDPLIAEAMVDERTYIPNVIDSTKVLTFTTNEAIKYGYCEGEFADLEGVMNKVANGKSYVLEEYKPDFWDNLKGLLLSPYFQSVLIMLIIGGIYFEIQTPGIGFALVVAMGAAVLYFAPLYIDGLAAYWEIIIFIIGLILIGLEVFVVPGFGIIGISGILLVVVGLVLSLLNNVDLDFETVELSSASRAIITVSSGLVLAFLLIIYLSSKIGANGIFKRLALDKKLEKNDGYICSLPEMPQFVGYIGTAFTDLRPSGKVIIDGQVFDAISLLGTFIEKGDRVVVKRYENGQLYVLLDKY